MHTITGAWVTSWVSLSLREVAVVGTDVEGAGDVTTGAAFGRGAGRSIDAA